MKRLHINSVFLLILIMFLFYSCNSDRNQTVLLSEDFTGLPRGPLGSGSGAHTEYHYIPEAAPTGNWAISTFRYNLPESWHVREFDGERAMFQDEVNTDKHWHPMVITGDELWRDYKVHLSYFPESTDKQSGLVFRYQNDRCYYFFGVDDNSYMLTMVKHATGFHEPYEQVLYEKDINGEINEDLEFSVAVNGNRIRAWINGEEFCDLNDTTYTSGKVGLLADIPARFYDIEVNTTRKEYEWLKKAKAEREELQEQVLAENPKMKFWKKISTEGFGVGRNLRFGDLNHDDTIDVLIGQVINHGPKDRNSELSCLTAMTFDGEMLWQIGQPDPWKTELTSDVAFQIHDLNNDGRNEVIYCMNQKIIVAEASTGKTLYERPTPLTPGGKPLPTGQNIFPRILGDCLFFCDLQGKGYEGDLIFKDRYKYVWAFDADLNLLWKNECNTGHYPYAYDMDEDGRDEVIMGYTLFDNNGEKLWSLDDTLQDHADGVAIVQYKEGEEPVYMCAASDEGMVFADMKGNIIKHHYIGHVQNPAVANFRDDLPGLETVSINFWGNQGIIHLYDADGNIYEDLEPNQYGSMCLPLNWTGKSEEYFILNPNVDEGGAWNGYGQKVLEFPDDGHPDMCYAVMDIAHDSRDEIVVWDPHEIWVYTQEDAPLEGELYKPERNPLSNYSNYQATVSLPGWSVAQ